MKISSSLSSIENRKRPKASFLDWNFHEIKLEFNIFTPWSEEAEDISNTEVLLSEQFFLSNKRMTLQFTDGYKLIILEKSKPIGWVYGFQIKTVECPDSKAIRLCRGAGCLTLEFDGSASQKNWEDIFQTFTLKENFEKKYTIEKIIGKGGFAKVYRVLSRTGEKFAAKVFQKNQSNDSAAEKSGLRNKVAK